MPWREMSTVSLRLELIEGASEEGANISALCVQFGVSRKTFYKWLKRFREEGDRDLLYGCRRPRVSPGRVGEEMGRAVLSARERHGSWGGRKIRPFLFREGGEGVPSASTVTEIARRNGGVDAAQSGKRRAHDTDSCNDVFH